MRNSCQIGGMAVASTMPAADRIQVQRRSSSACGRRISAPRDPRERRARRAHRRDRDTRCGSGGRRRREGGDRQHREVVAEHRPHAEREHQEPHHRQVGVPGLGEHRGSVEVGEHRERGAEAPEDRRPTPAADDQEREAECDRVERRGRGLHRPRRGSEELVEGREGPEAQRSGMATLMLEACRSVPGARSAVGAP